MENETTQKRNIFFEIIYVIILAVSVMGDMSGVPNNVTRMFKAASLLIVAVGAAVLLVTGRTERINTAGRFVGVYGFVLVGIIVWSIFLWIINLETVDFIARGTMKFMYQFFVLLVIFAASYLFGERSVYLTFYGIALANTVILFINMASYGPSESIQSFITMINTGEQTGFTRAMELHDITFTYGFFIIYALFFASHGRERNIMLIASMFFFILGWKRIAFAAIAIAMLLGLILGRMRSRTRINFMWFMAWTFVLLSFGYVVITHSGTFETITNYLDIDTMGRNEVYGYIQDYYDISIGFMGYGFEYTTVLLQQTMLQNPSAHIGVLALHNNILTVYIELGFVGFWAWILYTWIFQLRWMLTHWGEKTAMLFFLLETYIFITYTTDNTLYYYYTSLVLRLIPLAYTFHEQKAGDIKLWPWVRTQKLPNGF